MKTSILILLLATLLSTSCTDLDRDNPFDPKNPDAETYQVAVVENFVMHYSNSSTVPSPVTNSQDALSELTAQYSDRMIILEYHMPPYLSSNTDNLVVPEDTVRYNQYLGGTNRGFPHTFFNGPQSYIQGASSKSTVKTRYETNLDTLTLKKVKLNCSVTKILDGNTLNVSAQIARYGTDAISNLRVELILYEDRGDHLHYTVREIPQPDIISVQGQEIGTVDHAINLDISRYTNTANIGVVVIIKDDISKKILQAGIAKP